MAILSKIRERSLFLILVIGLALFAFVLDPSKIADFFGASKVNEIGNVNGEAITREEFAVALENYKSQVGSRVSEMQAAKSVWNNLVREKIYKKQLTNAGITIGEQDIMNSLYNNSQIKNDPRFQTSGIFDKNKLKQHLATIKEENNEEWKIWKDYMASIEKSMLQSAYEKLVGAGLGATLQEGKAQYYAENSKITTEFVQYPYTSIADSLVTVKDSEVENYIKDHTSEFEVEASRDVKFVKFEVEATPQDEEAIKNEVVKLIEDTNVGQNMVVKGLRNTTDYLTFLDENKSDLSLDNKIKFKSDFISSEVANNIFEKQKGEIYGPYKDEGYYKLTKVVDIIQIPDSVKAKHILISFVGSRSASEETKETEEQAKAKADSILNVVKTTPAKFADIAKELSSDKSNAEKGGDLGWFTYNAMVPEFRDFCFEKKEGEYGVVKTVFGFHIINIEEQKNLQNAVKLATFGRKIEPSEDTENAVFQKAESFALELSKGRKIDELAKDKGEVVQSAVSIKALDEEVPSLGKERQVVTWAFDKETDKGAYKRFDIEGGHHAVIVLTDKTEKGLMSTEKAMNKVRPILIKEKKAEMIKSKMKGATLEEIAKSIGQTKKTSTDVTLSSPTLIGVGFEPQIVGAMVGAKENTLKTEVVGEQGVYAFKVTKKESATELPNYDVYRKRIANQRKNKTYGMYEAIKKASDIEDNMSKFYGIEE